MAKRLDASLKGSSAWKKRLRQRQEETHQSALAIRRHRMDIVQGLLQHMTSLAERQRMASACLKKKNPKS